MSDTAYQPAEGTKDYVHVQVTQKNGQPVSPDAAPELYHPVAYAQVANLQGFKGDILYDPRTAKQKAVSAPAVDTVAFDGKLTTEADYRKRYQELFREVPPFNSDLTALKRIVDNAEKKLAAGPEDVEPVTPDEAAKLKVQGSGDNQPAFKAPADKAGWLALYRAAHPEDTTEDGGLTVPTIREKLGK